MSLFHFDRDSEIPAHVQVLEQVKVALAMGKLQPGDVLPSIRQVEAETGIGRMIVRRAYQLLEHAGFLELKHGKGAIISNHFSENTDLARKAEQLMVKFAEELERAGLEPVSFSRVFHHRLRSRDSRLPGVLCVDPSEALARELGQQIQRHLGVSVRALSLEQFAQVQSEVHPHACIAVNYYNLEDLREVISNDGYRIFPVSWKFSPGFLSKVRSLPPRSKMLVLYLREHLGNEGPQLALQELIREIDGRFFEVRAEAVEAVQDLSRLTESAYRAVLVSNRVWDHHACIFEQHPKFFLRLATRVNHESLQALKKELGFVF